MAVLDLTTEQIIALVQQLSPEEKQKVLNFLQEDRKKQHPWLKFAAKYKDDPQFEEMLANIALERENISETKN